MNIIMFSSLISICSGANILIMLPMSARSHYRAFIPLFHELSSKGHNITLVSPYEPTTQNWTHIKVVNFLEDEFKNGKDLNMFSFININKTSYVYYIWFMYNQITGKFLQMDFIKELLDGNNSFDLMISETLYYQEIFVVFGHIFNVPVINIEARPPPAWACYLTGNPIPLSYVPNFKYPFSDEMSFFERLINAYIHSLEFLGNYYYYIPIQEKILRKNLKHPKVGKIPLLLDMLRNTSLTLVDSHFSTVYIRPYQPNMVEVGGLTSYADTKLNKEFQEFMDESHEGVILFTVGSILRLSDMPPEWIDIFASTFKQLKHKVIMKWEMDELPNKPENVKVATWLPQNGILAHPNCVLFITHAGIHGLNEAIFHGVPLVVIPFFSDQEFNAKYAQDDGFAYVIKPQQLTKENLLKAVTSVLNNSSYTEKVKRRSAIMTDKPLSPLETAVFWTEYVLRHNGAHHLKPASLKLNWFQYYLLDILIFIFTAFLSVVIIMFLVLRFLKLGRTTLIVVSSFFLFKAYYIANYILV